MCVVQVTEKTQTLEIPQIGKLGEPRLFSLGEAEVLLPLIRKITKAAHSEWLPLRDLVRNTLSCDPRLGDRQSAYAAIVQTWSDKVERLGPVVAGLWHVDFFTGDGFLCWKYPEIRIAYYHAVSDSCNARQPIAAIVDAEAPDWAWPEL